MLHRCPSFKIEIKNTHLKHSNCLLFGKREYKEHCWEHSLFITFSLSTLQKQPSFFFWGRSLSDIFFSRLWNKVSAISEVFALDSTWLPKKSINNPPSLQLSWRGLELLSKILRKKKKNWWSELLTGLLNT